MTVSINAEIIKTRLKEVSKHRPASIYFSCDDCGRLFLKTESRQNTVCIEFYKNIFGSLKFKVEVHLPSYDGLQQKRLVELVTKSVKLALKK